MSIEKKVSEYYTQKILEHGISSQGVDWNSKESQFLRFKQLCKIFIDEHHPFSILDYGCGYGGLVEFLSDNNIPADYIGYDISQEMIKQAKVLYPDDKFTSEKPTDSYDYIIASGIFNVKLDASVEEWEKYIIDTLNYFNQHAKKAFSFNILTGYSDKEFMKKYLYYANPCFYFDFCKINFSKNIALLHDYNLYEFTILVKK